MTTYFSYPSIEVQKELRCIAETLVTCGKGILAADESVCTMGKRLQEIGVSNEEDIRRQWRQTLFSTDRQIADYISGVILFHETLCQKDENGKPLTDYLKERCIIPGVKVDTGLVTLYNSEDEVTTQGLDNLGARLAQYKAEGIEFARWRTVFKIGKNTPSYHAISTNAMMIARFASICQSQRICPIIEPEVIPDGEHDIERCQKVTETVLSFVYKALNDHHIYLEGTLLKPNMVTSGLSNMHREEPHVIAHATLTALRRTVPPAVPGIVFSSGGQTEEEATCNLNAINQADGCKPWKLTFAYGRALQASALRAWAGRHENEKAAQDEFLKRAKANGEASQGGQHQGGRPPQHSNAKNATTRFGDTRKMHAPPRNVPSMHPGEEECCGNKGGTGTQRRPSGSHSSGPHSSGPHSSGPHGSGPHGSGPHGSSPHSSGPHSSGPHSSGPYSSGPHSKQPYGHSPRHSPGLGTAAKSPRYGSGSGGHKYLASKSNPRFAHPATGLEAPRFQETNMGPDGQQSRYDPKECARYSANNTNLDHDLTNIITKTTETTSDTANRTTK